MKTILEINNLTKSYPNGEEKLQVLKGLNLTLNLSESLAIKGESGSGKTTLLRIIGALDFDFSGEVIINGQNIKSLSSKEAANFRAKTIGFVFQTHYFLPQFTLLENVLLPSLVGAENLFERAKYLLDKAGVYDLKDRYSSEVSGGQLQRAALARALINSPKILLADEPTGALDAKNAEKLAEFLAGLADSGLSLISVTHSDKFAKSMSKIYTLENGNLSI